MPRKFRAPSATLPFSLAAFASGQTFPKGELPERILVLPWGESHTRKGLVVCNATTLAQLPARQAAEKYDVVAFDFQHNTVKDGPEPKPVAGYGIPEIVEDEGVYLSSIDYTPEGEQFLKGGHYPDISPAVIRNGKGEVLFLHSVGACRQGEIDGLTLFSAGASEALDSFMADEEMPEGESTEPTGLRAVLVQLLNALNPEAAIAADASDGDIAAAATAAAEAMAKPAEGDKVPAEFSARLVALEADLSASRRETLVARAAAEGKVIPLSADELGKVDITILSSMIDQLPVTVPLEARTAGAVDDFQARPGTITPEAREVARQLGIDPATL